MCPSGGISLGTFRFRVHLLIQINKKWKEFVLTKFLPTYPIHIYFSLSNLVEYRVFPSTNQTGHTVWLEQNLLPNVEHLTLEFREDIPLAPSPKNKQEYIQTINMLGFFGRREKRLKSFHLIIRQNLVTFPCSIPGMSSRLVLKETEDGPDLVYYQTNFTFLFVNLDKVTKTFYINGKREEESSIKQYFGVSID